MKPRAITPRVDWLGAVDWDRRLFDSLIPLPEGTSYNAYLVRGSEKTALLDTVDPAKADELFEQLRDVPKLDYIISHHVEQDHSGTIPKLLAKYPEAKLIASTKAKPMLAEHLGFSPDIMVTVADGETLSLGDRTLRFIHTPWVHWPETMCTWLEEEKILFSCDFLGSHLASSDLYATDEARVYQAAKRYYAEIMMPFRKIINKSLEKVAALEPKIIAPSHGPVYARPALILDAYREWLLSPPKNQVLLAYVSMHDSTRRMTDHLTGELCQLGIGVERFDLETTDLGALAMALVDAATVVLGTPTVLMGPHPLAANAAYLANALKPKTRFLGVYGSYGWGGKTADMLASMLGGLDAELLPPVLVKGLPNQAALSKLDELARAIAEKHASLGLMPKVEADQLKRQESERLLAEIEKRN